MATVKRRERLFGLAGYQSLLNCYAQLDARLNLQLDPEVGSRLDGEYSVTRVATKVAWYSPCMICSRGGASASSGDGCKGWVVGWV